MPTRSQNNAAIRTALTTRWPRTRFGVRNGQRGLTALTWTDGPTQDQVLQHLSRHTPGAGAAVERLVSPTLAAVAFWRARVAGDLNAYSFLGADGTTLPAGAEPLLPSTRWSMKAVWEQLDEATITDDERTVAHAVRTLTGSTGSGTTPHETCQPVAATIARHYDELVALLEE